MDTIPAGTNLDSIVIGYYEGEELIYLARVRNGFTPASRSEESTKGSRLIMLRRSTTFECARKSLGKEDEMH